MLSISNVKNAAQAASYYEQADDYYSESGSAPTEWHGKGAEALGLAGEVDSDQFQQLLKGVLPDGQKMAAGSGGKNHRPGWDLTFSAPKSVSIMALVTGDQRLVEAHEAAVRITLNKIEKDIQTRVKKDGQVEIEKTGNLVAATFRHETNRNLDPQLHTHSIILNITQRADGEWRAIESKNLFQIQKQLGEAYRQELARQVVRLGYNIDKQSGKHASMFEIAGVSKELIDKFSSRSQEVEAALEKQGLNRETASAKQKDAASVGTRQKKYEIDHGQLRKDWLQHAASNDLEQVKASAISANPPVSQDAAKKALEHATEKLSERDSVFAKEKLVEEALRFGLGYVSRKDIEYQISSAAQSGQLILRKIDDSESFTTSAALQREEKMIGALKRAQGTGLPLMSSTDAENLVYEKMKEAHKQNLTWNVGQIRATKNLLESMDRINVIQGYAGTAKTTTVLKTAAEAYTKAGYDVLAMAPTHASVNVLAEAIGAPGVTVQKSLIQLAAGSVNNDKQQVWMVDEASMLSSKQMAELVRQAERYDARLILVGDVKQLASQEAGAAFRQVQEHLKTNVLDEIVRQKNKDAKSAVEATIENDLQTALEMVDRVGGVIEANSRAARVEAISKDYVNLTPDQREKTLVIAPGRDDRDEVNHKIRDNLVMRGEVEKDGLITETYQAKNLTAAEAKDAASFEPGDTLKFLRDYEKNEIKKDDYFKVIEVNQQENTLKIQGSAGDIITINPRTQTKFESYNSSQREFAAGDKIVINQTSQDLKNGDEGFIKSVKGSEVTVTVNSKDIKIDVSKEANRHLDYGYSTTAHKAQGKTVDRVLIHAESHRQNLMNQKSLYVSLSRAKQWIRVYTDSREELVQKVQERKAEKVNAMDNTHSPSK